MAAAKDTLTPQVPTGAPRAPFVVSTWGVRDTSEPSLAWPSNGGLNSALAKLKRGDRGRRVWGFRMTGPSQGLGFGVHL